MKRQWIVVLLLVMQIGCLPVDDDESVVGQSYVRIIKLSGPQREKAFDALSPDERVGVYLYGIHYRRPRDYTLGQYFSNASPAEVASLIAHLRSADSGASTYGLVAALYAIAQRGNSQKYRIDEGFSARASCDRFFSPRSPCHDLARDIDQNIAERRRATPPRA